LKANEDGSLDFCGNLDIDTLGGAGFASQRTVGEDRHWDLSAFDGLQLEFDVDNTDRKKYTLILKDTLLPTNPADDREQSTVSWEHDFSTADVGSNDKTQSPRYQRLFIPWHQFKPTYRGKPVTDTPDLVRSDVRRISVMIRR
jgi:hypothetical protein